jgi:hypothetical protein
MSTSDAEWPDWANFTLGRFFFENYGRSAIFLATNFHGKIYVLILKKTCCATFLAIFFTNASGRPSQVTFIFVGRILIFYATIGNWITARVRSLVAFISWSRVSSGFGFSTVLHFHAYFHIVEYRVARFFLVHDTKTGKNYTMKRNCNKWS